MFKPKPQYTTADLDAAVKRLSDLERLQDAVEQKLRLHTNLPKETLQLLNERYRRYDMDIKSAQLRLDYMQREGIK